MIHNALTADPFRKLLPASGLQWRHLGTEPPPQAELLEHEGLARALRRKNQATTELFEFSAAEWARFGVTGLRLHHYVRAGDAVFAPVEEEEEEEEEEGCVSEDEATRPFSGAAPACSPASGCFGCLRVCVRAFTDLRSIYRSLCQSIYMYLSISLSVNLYICVCM